MNIINNKRKLLIGILIAIVVVLGTSVLYSYRDYDTKKNSKRISIIVYGSEPERWENLKKGAVLAGDDFGAEISLLTTSEEDDYEEQISLIEREISNGVDGIMLAPCDSKKLGEYLDKARIKIPVVLIENTVTSRHKYNCISIDDYNMGYELGNAIISRENPIIKAAVISDSTQRDNIVAREQGVRDVLEPYANQVVTWERDDYEKQISTKKFLQRKLIGEAVDVIVALDTETADAIMDALDNLNMTRKVYVISTSSQSVYNLDQRNIKVIEYQNEFGIGYVGAYSILDKKTFNKRFNKDVIESNIVDKENMYDYDNQKLLFPFVK